MGAWQWWYEIARVVLVFIWFMASDVFYQVSWVYFTRHPTNVLPFSNVLPLAILTMWKTAVMQPSYN